MLLNKNAFVKVVLEDFMERKSSGGILLEKIVQNKQAGSQHVFMTRRSGHMWGESMHATVSF